MTIPSSLPIDPVLLEAFLAVADQLNFSRAATELHVTQPALSRSVQRLERQLGTTLFTRTTRQVALTPQGAALMGPARKVLEAQSAALRAVTYAEQGLTGTLRLGFPGPSASAAVGQLVQLVRKSRPGIEITLRSGALGYQAAQWLLEGELDLAVLRWRRRPEGLTSRVFSVDQHVVVLPKDHPLASRESISVTEMRDENWVILDVHGSPLLETFWAKCNQHGFFPKVSFRAPDAWTGMALVAAGMGVMINYEATFRGVPRTDIVVVPISDNMVSYARLAWRSADQSPALRAVLRLSHEIFPTVTS